MIYFDHAATSWPKPPEVIKAITDFLEHSGGNPGRAGHRLSIDAGRIVYAAREALAELFNASDPLRIVFTANATYAINLGLLGLLRPGDHVVTSAIEHNAVMRPLRELENRGLHLTVVPCACDGRLNPQDIADAMQPSTRMVVLTHASNVMGTMLPITEAAAIAHRAGAWILVDAAQTAGVVPIDMQAMGIDLLAFTGHKGLQGPPGTGGLIIGDGVPTEALRPLVRGGTGSRSELEVQPEDSPDKYESGTLNGPGIAGLGAGVRWILERGVPAIRAHEIELAQTLVNGLAEIPGVTLYGPQNWACRTSVVSFSSAKHRVSEIGLRLDEEFEIMSRIGLHCAPAAHRTIGSFPEGTVRFAPGIGTTRAEVQTAIEAIALIMK